MIALLYDIIFISTHKNDFYTFYLYIHVIMKLLRKVLKRKKKVETPDLIIKLDHKCLLMYSY